MSDVSAQSGGRSGPMGPQRAGARSSDEGLPTGRRSQSDHGVGNAASQAASQQQASARLSAQVEAARAAFDAQRQQQLRASASPPLGQAAQPAIAPAGQTMADPRGLYDPATGLPWRAGMIGAQTIAGTVGVGQVSAQVPTGMVGQPGLFGGRFEGVVAPGVYGPAGQVAPAAVPAEDQWLARLRLNADGWLELPVAERASRLRRGGCSDASLGRVASALDAFAAARTRRGPFPNPYGLAPFAAPAGQAVVPGTLTVTTTPAAAGPDLVGGLITAAVAAALVAAAWYVDTRHQPGR